MGETLNIAVPVPVAGRAVAGSPPAFRARVHGSLAAARPTWLRLEAEGTATPFQTFDVASRLLAATAADGAPLVVTLDQPDGTPALLLPLVLRRRGPWRVVEAVDGGLADYVAPLWSSSLGPDRAAEAWRAIRAALPPADLLHLPKLPLAVDGRPNPLAVLPGCRPMRLQAFGTPIASPWPACASAILRKSVRTRLDRRWRRLADRGPVRFLAPETPGEADALFERLVALRRARFGALGRPEPLERPEVRELYRGLLRDGLAAGTCRITGLQVGDEVIGAVYGLIRHGRYHMLIPAFADGDWRRSSPGLQVLRETMRWAAEAGLTHFDFTIGGEGYKGELGASPEPLAELIEPLSWRGRPLAAAMTAKRRLQESERLRRIVARLRDRGRADERAPADADD